MKRFVLICVATVVVSIGLLGFTVSQLPSKVSILPTEHVYTQLETSIQNTIDNVVHIRNNTGQWQGSGVLVTPDLVLTARHVAESGQDFDITTNDGKIYKVTRAISSKKYDLGFIKLDVKLPCTTKLGSIQECRLGESVYAVGSPFGDVNFNSVTLGIISSLSRELEKFDCPKEMGWSVSFQTDAAGHPGNSGCPVFTVDGVVRGILVGGFSNSLIYCIPVDLVANDCLMVQSMFAMEDYKLEQLKDTRLEELYSWMNEHREITDLQYTQIKEIQEWILNHHNKIEMLWEWLIHTSDTSKGD